VPGFNPAAGKSTQRRDRVHSPSDSESKTIPHRPHSSKSSPIARLRAQVPTVYQILAASPSLHVAMAALPFTPTLP